jgi:hypothetical protein
MANLTLRSIKGSALTMAEMDGNFEYFTGSYTNDGIITAQGFDGTASYATQALSASYAPSTSPFPHVGDAEFSGSVFVSGSIIPNVDGMSSTSSFSLGSPTAAWKDIYVSDGTINFVDGAGNVQGTLGAGSNGTVITGSFTTIQTAPLLDWANRSTLLNKSYTSADCSFAFANQTTQFSTNAQIYTLNSFIVLPWDKKITSYSLVNNLTSVVGSNQTKPIVSLPPILNTGYSVGETVTVYNMGEYEGLWKSSGSIYIVASAQGVTQIDSNAKTITGTAFPAYILSGSWGNYTAINHTISATTHSIKIDPGQKATFEIVYWGSQSPLPSASADNFTQNGYHTNFTTTNPSSTYTHYLFKGIENL